MTFHIVTIFPEVFKPYLKESILGRGVKRGLVKIKLYDLRKFAVGRYNKVDDKPYGGGPGMVMKLAPLVKVLEEILRGKPRDKTKVLLMAPSGKAFDSRMAAGLAKRYRHVVVVAGRYEGVDDRLKKILNSKAGLNVRVDEVSTGPYVLTGGELPALTVLDAVARHVEGVLGKVESLEEKRFGVGVPSYTRPETFKYKRRQYPVPKVLLSGDHKKIDTWRKKHRRTSGK